VRNYGGDVENENNCTVTKNRSAADESGGHEAIFERFDDELFFSHEAINDQAEFTIAGADDDNEKTFGALGLGFRLEAVEAVETVETDERENLLAQLKNLVLVDAVNFIVGNASNFDDRSDGNGIQAACNAKQKCLDAGES